MSDDRLYLIHILESIERIEDYTREGREAFISNGQGDPLRKLGEELPATSPVHFRPAGVIL